jgi:membrane protein DedA with SNARE-associated domain
MFGFAHAELNQLISNHGYTAVAVIVGLESMGIPLPGETVLVLAAIYAGSGQGLDIWGVVAAAAAGAILGDNAGFWLGREFGYPLLLRYCHFLRLSPQRIKLAQLLFLRHGGKIVFFGRFVALLRILAAFLAGMNRMEWWRFLFANAGGGIVWAGVFGFGAYWFGVALNSVSGPLRWGLLVIGLSLLWVGGLVVRSQQKELEAEADRAFPGPLP